MRKVSQRELVQLGVYGADTMHEDEVFCIFADMTDGTSVVIGFPDVKPCESFVEAFKSGAFSKVETVEIIEVRHDA